MTYFEPFDFAPLLRPEGFCCACGRVHRADIRLLAVGPNILSSLPDQLDALGFVRPFIVADALNVNVAVLEPVLEQFVQVDPLFFEYCH